MQSEKNLLQPGSLINIIFTVFRFRLVFLSTFLLFFIFSATYVFMLKPQYHFNKLISLISLTTFFHASIKADSLGEQAPIINNKDFIGYLTYYVLPTILIKYNKNHKNKLFKPDIVIEPKWSNKILISMVNNKSQPSYEKFNFISDQIVAAANNYEQPHIKEFKEIINKRLNILDQEIPHLAKLLSIENNKIQAIIENKPRQLVHHYDAMQHLNTLDANENYDLIYRLKLDKLLKEEALSSFIPLHVSETFLVPILGLPFIVKIVLVFILSLIFSVLVVLFINFYKFLRITVSP